MKHRREHLLKQIGIGIQEARFNRMQQTAPKYVRTEYPIRTLKGVQIVPSEFLEYGKKRILQDFAGMLYESSVVNWTITDDYDPIHEKIKIEGTLRVVGPKEEP